MIVRKTEVPAVLISQNQLDYSPKISIIIPIYNCEKYIPDCFEMISRQTLKEIEVICINDGSPDGSLELVKGIASKKNFVTVLTQENSGAGLARNNGIKYARGEFIAFMDADDMYPEDNTLEKMYYNAIKFNVNICGGSLWEIRDNKIFKDSTKFEEKYTFKKNGLVKFKDYQFDYGYWRFIYKREFIIKNEIQFPDYLRGQDPPFFVRAMVLAEEFYAMVEPTYVYRTSYKQVNWTKRKLCDAYESDRVLLKICRKNEFYDLYCRVSQRILKPFLTQFIDVNDRDVSTSVFAAINEIDKNILNKRTIDVKFTDIHKKIVANNMPKISVIVPVYNVEKYLGVCLDSLLSQTFSDIEIICVNDGSTDTSLNILNEYNDKYNNIRIISTPNKGLGHARNTGVREAKSPYIFFIDSDDWLDKTCLEKLYASIRKEDSDICIYGLQKYDEINKKYINDNYFDLSCYGSSIVNGVSYKDIKESIFMRFGAVLKMYKKDFFVKNNLFFDESVFYEDVFTHIKTIVSSEKICFCDELLYFYRINREGSIMTVVDDPKKITDIYIYLKNVEDFLRQRKVFEELEYFFFKFMFEQLSFHSRRQNVLKEFFVNETISFLANYDINIILKKYKDIKCLYDKIGISVEDVLNAQCNRYKSPTSDTPFDISVIIPVYNVEKYINECVDSVLNQTFKNFEIILINDGSTDNSLKKCKEYERDYKNITLINQKNNGQAYARNKALTLAKGKYVLFLDSDDYLHEDTLKRLYEGMETYTLDMLSFSGVNFVDGSEDFQPNEYWNYSYLPETFNINSFTWRDCKNFMHRLPVSAALTMYRLEFIHQNKINFPEHVFFEDNVFFVKALTSAKLCGITKEKFYYRRIHTNSTTQNWAKNFGDYIKISDMVLSYLKSINMEKSVYEAYRSSYVGGSLRRYQSFEVHWQEKYRSAMVSLLKKYHWPVESLAPVKLWFGTDNVNGEKKIFFCKKAIYHRTSCEHKKRIELFGIELFKRRISPDYRKIFLLGVEVYKKKQTSTKTRISILGIPVYSVKKRDYEVTRRILFFKYKTTNRIQAIQDKLWYNQQQVAKLAKELADSRREIASLRNEVKTAASKPRRFILTEVEDK